MGSWKTDQPRKLKKIVFGLTDTSIKKVISDHESRGWVKASEIKEHGYGLGCLMVWSNSPEQIGG
jgi:hypothetical protein